MNDLIPKICPSCQSVLRKEGVNLVCINQECDEQQIQKLIYWCEEVGIENFSKASIRTLYNKKIFKSILDIYANIDLSLLESIDGFGGKKIKSMNDEIEKSKTMNVYEFVNALGINLVGKKAVKKLGINSVDELFTFQDTSSVVGKNLIEYRTKNLAYITALINRLNITNIIQGEDKKKVALTGKYDKMSRKELVKIIEDKGMEFVSSVTKDTNILICADVNGTSSKLVKAKKNGTELVSYTEFFEEK